MSSEAAKWRWIGAAALPFLLTLLLVVVTEALSDEWPTRVGRIQTVGLMLATVGGVLSIPRLSWLMRAMIAVVYCPVMYWVLFFFALFLVGLLYGNTL
jgi:hypothetical protein